jgi:3-hydroxyacyl-CoA dehydrogenase
MKITVIGAGIMGSGIACSSSVAGFETTLSDVSGEVLDKAFTGFRHQPHHRRRGVSAATWDGASLTMRNK